MADPIAQEFEAEELMNYIIRGSDEQGAHQEHEDEDDGSQYLALDQQGEQQVGDDNAGEVLKRN